MVLVVVVIAVIIAAFLVMRSCSLVALLPEGEEAVVTIEQGEGAKNIAESLRDEHLISNADDFVSLVNSKGVAGSLIPGTYLFHGGMTQDEILDVILQGPSATGQSLVIPEGFTRQNVADAVQTTTNGRITADAFMTASADASKYVEEYSFLTDAGTNSLEGFLFPKTYSITAGDTAESVVKMMLEQYGQETADLDWSYPEDAGLDQYEALILASIVEKESNRDSLATVASVFYNRLSSDRPYLESDATTAYEVGHDPTPDEVHADTPYSTYTNSGLPPTPICNPSIEAIQAVCSPDSTDYLFFFTNADGTHSFSRTYEQHQRTFS